MKTSHPFTEQLQALFWQNGWVWPKSFVPGIYEARIRELEAEIARLKGEQQRQRINPLEKVKRK